MLLACKTEVKISVILTAAPDDVYAILADIVEALAAVISNMPAVQRFATGLISILWVASTVRVCHMSRVYNESLL